MPVFVICTEASPIQLDTPTFFFLHLFCYLPYYNPQFGTFWRLAQGIYWKLVLFDVFGTLFEYFDIWVIHLSSPEQESYSEVETDRSARTGGSEIFKD